MENKKPKNSKAKLEANARYNAKTYERIALVVKKGEREYYHNKATELGYSSLNQFIKDAINEKIEREDA